MSLMLLRSEAITLRFSGERSAFTLIHERVNQPPTVRASAVRVLPPGAWFSIFRFINPRCSAITRAFFSHEHSVG